MQSAAARAALVDRLDRESRQSPGFYKFKLALLAILGFAVLGGSAAAALAVSAGLVIGLAMLNPLLLVKLVKVIWIPLGFGWLVLRALWVKFAPPDGYRVQPGEAPELFAEVERLRKATGAPKLEAILINADLNAAAASVPRASGLFGHRHYLVLGLPLMQLLGREEMAAVIAHEFGHFGGGHNRFGGWIYQIRLSWYRVLGALSESGTWAAKPFAKFFDWYAPFFNAYSFALARANEYQADAAAAAVVGAGNAGRALVQVQLGSERLERDFWPVVQKRSLEQPLPPARLYDDMARQLRSPTPDDASRLEEAMSATPGYEDTHPTLSQRLLALGVEVPRTDEVPAQSAAELLLGDLAGVLEERFSSEWREAIEKTWAENHSRYVGDTARFAELEQVAEKTPEQVVEFAQLTESLHPQVDALPLYRHAVEVAPENPYMRFRLGQLLLERKDESGVEHLRAAMAMDSSAVEFGSMILAEYFASIGNEAGQAEADAAREALYREQRRVHAERNRVTTSDKYSPHDLSDETVEALRVQLDKLDTVKKAWVVRKHVSDDPNQPPHYVVLVAWRGMVFSENGNLQRVVDALELPGSFIAITAPNQRRVARRVKKAAGAPTYAR